MNFSAREKLLLYLLALILCPLLLERFVLSRVVEKSKASEAALVSYVREMEEFDLLGQEYVALQRVLAKASSLDLSGLLFDLSEARNIESRPEIVEIGGNDSLRRARVKFRKIRNDELINIVYDIESHSPVVLIDQIDVERSIGAKDYLDASLVLIVE